MRLRTVLGVVLAGSVLLNVYLVWSRSRDADVASVATQTATSTAARPQPKPVARARRQSPRHEVMRIPTEIATLDRARLEERLAAAEARLAELIPLHEAFEVADHSPETEARLRPLFEDVFAESPYDLECRGDICMVKSEDPSKDWRAAMRDHPDSTGLFSAVEVSDAVWLRVEEAGRAAGIRLSFTLIMALARSPAVVACKQAHPTPGVIELALRFDRATRRLMVEATGSLARQAGGVCIRRVLEDLIASTPIPPEVTAVHERPFPVRIP